MNSTEIILNAVQQALEPEPVLQRIVIDLKTDELFVATKQTASGISAYQNGEISAEQLLAEAETADRAGRYEGESVYVKLDGTIEKSSGADSVRAYQSLAAQGYFGEARTHLNCGGGGAPPGC